MAVMEGCEGGNKTRKLEERKCPNCGRDVEVFTNGGRITEDATCECGYVFKAQEQIPKSFERE